MDKREILDSIFCAGLLFVVPYGLYRFGKAIVMAALEEYHTYYG